MGGGRGRLRAGAAGPRRLRVDILVLAFLGKCASLQHRACVGAKLDCKAVIQRRGKSGGWG